MSAPRSWLFVPGDSRLKIERALQGEADALILDWEDAVAPGAKALAREVTVSALAESGAPAARSWVRVNALDSEAFEADLAALPARAIAGVVLPKACGPDSVLRLGSALDAVEARAGLTPGVLRIVAIVTETAASVLALSDFRRPVPRLAAMMWGGEDLASDLGVRANRDASRRMRPPFELARNLTLMAATAAQCSAIDAVCVDFRDVELLARECAEACADGYTGKAAIHPGQVPVVNACFAPSEAALAWARQVVQALAGGGLAVVEGRMVDAPHLRMARRILGEA